MTSRVEQHWYQANTLLNIILTPLAWLFRLLILLRKFAYHKGLLRSFSVSCPLVVIGNINIGGVGKTPLIQHLLQEFSAKSIRVGVISRGYGRESRHACLVKIDSSSQEVGDEPLMLAQTGAPIAVGADRVAAARLLLKAFPDLDLILSDDGLQHYRMARDLEIVVLDAARGFGNGHLLPNGPLREPISRLDEAQAIVLNGLANEQLKAQLPVELPCFSMRLQPELLYRLNAPATTAIAKDFFGLKIIALAGIGNPERFFVSLRKLGISLNNTLVFPDHHRFCVEDLPSEADILIVTSKDAIKLRKFSDARLWVLPVSAQISPDLASWLLTRLGIEHRTADK